MKFKVLVLLLCGAITSSGVQAMDGHDQGAERRVVRLQPAEFRRLIVNSFDTPSKKLQLATSIARLPFTIAANFLKKKHHKVGYLVSALANAVRLVDNSLSIVNNGWNKYNIFLTGYDLVRCGKDIATAFSNDALEAAAPVSTMSSMITSARKILLPLIESYYAANVAIPILEEEFRSFYQSLSTFAQLLSDYLDSPSNSIESKFLLACLLVNGGCASYDYTKIVAWNRQFEADLQNQENHHHQNDNVQPVLNAHVVGEGENAHVILQREQGVDIQSNASCPICLNEYEANDELSVFPCNHSYCTGCFDRGMNVRPQEIRANNLEELLEQGAEIHQNMGLRAAQNQCGLCREPIARNTTARIVIGENIQQNN